MFSDLSNWRRWGTDDQLGTINLVTPERHGRPRRGQRDAATSAERWRSATRGGDGVTVSATGNGDNQSGGGSFKIIADTEDWDDELCRAGKGGAVA